MKRVQGEEKQNIERLRSDKINYGSKIDRVVKLKAIDEEMADFSYKAKDEEEKELLQKKRAEEFKAKKEELENNLGPLDEESLKLIQQHIVDDVMESAIKENERYNSLSSQKKILEEIINCPESKDQIEIPESNFVAKEICYFMPDSQFATNNNDVSEVPTLFYRPLLVGDLGKEATNGISETAMEAKSTIDMGKAVFFEYPLEIDGVTYDYVQYKGVCRNQVNEKKSNIASEISDSTFPLGKDGIAPFFVGEVGKNFLARWLGTAYYEDLIIEKEKSEMMSKFGLRMPKILATIKFSRQFCIENNLPVPENDDPENSDGPSPLEFLKDKVSPDIYHILEKTFDMTSYQSAVMGQNVRCFRNVWRVSEVEGALNSGTEENKEEIKQILSASIAVLEKEFGGPITEIEYLQKMAAILGEQMAILIENDLQHGALDGHHQNITLAGEICDFDTSYQLNDEYFTNQDNYPDWMKRLIEAMKIKGDKEREKALLKFGRKDEKDGLLNYWNGNLTESELMEEWLADWKKDEKGKLYKQILQLGAHIKPMVEAVKLVGFDVDEKDVMDEYKKTILEKLSPDKKKEVIKFLEGFKK